MVHIYSVLFWTVMLGKTKWECDGGGARLAIMVKSEPKACGWNSEVSSGVGANNLYTCYGIYGSLLKSVHGLL